MTVLGGLHHAAVLTTDLKRLVAFYRTVFDAEPVADLIDEDVRSVLIDVGGGGFVHAYQVPEGQIPLAGQPKYQRGHVDHIGLVAPTQEAFLAVRRRAMEVGATDGRVRDFGAAWGMKFRDPDGMQGDLMWADPDAPLTAFRQYADAPVGAALSTPTSPPVIGTSALPPVLSTTGGGQRPIRAFRTTGCG